MTDNTPKNNNSRLPGTVWPASSLKKLEKEGAASLGVTLYELMLRAGNAVFEQVRQIWPAARHWLVLAGHGNNGGDGYVVARLAQAAGCTVTLIACESETPLPEEACQARQSWLDAGGRILPVDAAWPDQIDVIIDALLGTGLNRAPAMPYNQLIRQANVHRAPVFAIDIPSGLAAATGSVAGEAIYATHTLTVIALKPGLLTGRARDHIGQLHYHALGLERWLRDQTAPLVRYDAGALTQWLKPRRPTSNKGDHGRLLVVGGDLGTAGAIRMAGEAALRAGAGLVRVLTHKDNVGPLLVARPELMVHELTPAALNDGMEWADMMVVGPGLGQREWGQNALNILQQSAKPMLWDADALNLLAIVPDNRQNRIITPHPGEAARLLGVSIAEVEHDRLSAARCLVQQYGGIVVLKGAGTIIASEQGAMAFADVGNAGMASGGMGDVLSGIIGALAGQKLPLYEAACAGCVVHGAAADAVAATHGTRGMLATDLFTTLGLCVNPEMTNINL